MSNMNTSSKVSNLSNLIILLLGVALGWLGFLLVGDLAGNTKVVYVSQKEILRLEKERLARLAVKEQGKAGAMFFGRINQALALTQKIAERYQNNSTKLVFVTEQFVKGVNTESISDLVYQEVITTLQPVEDKGGG